MRGDHGREDIGSQKPGHRAYVGPGDVPMSWIECHELDSPQKLDVWLAALRASSSSSREVVGGSKVRALGADRR